MADGHVVLAGMAAGEPRVTEFDCSEVETARLVTDRARRLRDRPTLAIGLRGRGRLLIAELSGIGITAEIFERLTSSIEPPLPVGCRNLIVMPRRVRIRG